MSSGIHSKLNGFDKDLIPRIKQAKPPIFFGVGTMDELDIMKDLHSALPDTIFGYRVIDKEKHEWDNWINNLDPIVAADMWLAQIDQIITAKGGGLDFIHWQFCNERKDYAWLAKFEKYALEAGNILRYLFAFATGNPNPEDFETLRPAFVAAHATKGMARIAWHLYWPGTDPTFQFADFLGRYQIGKKFCKDNGFVIAHDCTEFGAEPGFHGWSNVTADEYVNIGIKADLMTPDIIKAWYDCSGIADDRTGSPDYSIQLPVGLKGEQKRVIDLLLPEIEVQQPATDQEPPIIELPPDTPPIPEPEPSSVVWSLHLDNYNHVFAADDKTGDRWIPADKDGKGIWTYEWKDSDDKITHVEPFPAADSGYNKPSAVRFQNEADRSNFWAVIKLDTMPGDEIRVSAESTAELMAEGSVVRQLVVDVYGGEDATGKSLPKVVTNVMDKPDTMDLVVVAAGEHTTVMFRVFCTTPARFNVDLSKLDISVKHGTVQPPPPPPPDDGTRYVTSTSGAFLRSTPLYKADKSNVVGELKYRAEISVKWDTVIPGGLYNYVELKEQPKLYIAEAVVGKVKPI